MGSMRSSIGRRGRAARRWPALALIGVLAAAGCDGPGTTKSGSAPDGTITLTFASADPVPADTAFAALVAKDSGGHLKLHTIYYNARSTSVDRTIAAALAAGKLDVGDVASRAWESFGIEAFRAFQVPFLVTSRTLLDRAVTGPVAAGMLAALKPAKVTGLAIVPASIRYLLSTRRLTGPAQFSGAKIRINDSTTSSEVISALGATPVTTIASGHPPVRALRDGELTAIEAGPGNAIAHGYLRVAPYVLVNAPLFAKTTTLAVSSTALARLPAADVGWLREAAVQAAAGQAASTSDRAEWASMCGQGLKPLAATQDQFQALHAAEAPAYAALAADPTTSLAIDRIGGLATTGPRMDDWATCHGVGIAGSATKALDGRYGTTFTQAEVVASGDCPDCGDAGTYALTIHDGRYALYHPVQLHAKSQRAQRGLLPGLAARRPSRGGGRLHPRQPGHPGARGQPAERVGASDLHLRAVSRPAHLARGVGHGLGFPSPVETAELSPARAAPGPDPLHPFTPSPTTPRPASPRSGGRQAGLQRAEPHVLDLQFYRRFNLAL
jgi:TRAP-type C4-dicarboxylate transport system substrate-binding protein